MKCIRHPGEYDPDPDVVARLSKEGPPDRGFDGRDDHGSNGANTLGPGQPADPYPHTTGLDVTIGIQAPEPPVKPVVVGPFASIGRKPNPPVLVAVGDAQDQKAYPATSLGAPARVGGPAPVGPAYNTQPEQASAKLPSFTNTIAPSGSDLTGKPCAGCSAKKVAPYFRWTTTPQSWDDLPIARPADPRSFIANSSLGATQGVFMRSTTYSAPATTWLSNSPLKLVGDPVCSALGTDDQYLVALAAQWNFLHRTRSNNANISPLLANVIYVRAGRIWNNAIPLNTTSATLVDIQLSNRDNAAVTGDFIGGSTGGIPVISYTGSFNGAITLNLTFPDTGRYFVGIRAIDNTGKYSMFGLECVAVK